MLRAANTSLSHTLVDLEPTVPKKPGLKQGKRVGEGERGR